jgi:hypothetical protein
MVQVMGLLARGIEHRANPVDRLQQRPDVREASPIVDVDVGNLVVGHGKRSARAGVK